jgi:hypothetical protein
MNEYVLSDAHMPFPSCTAMQQIEGIELIIFGLFPSLRSFTREITPVERAGGIIYPHALVEKTPNGISRKYGAMIAHIGDLQ